MARNPAPVQELLLQTAKRAARYLEDLDSRSVIPTARALRNLGSLPRALPMRPTPPEKVLEMLDQFGSPATVASNGGRYFGFVIGSALPTALAASWLAGAWNQNAARAVMSPAAARLESSAVRWIREVLGLPRGADGAFVSGATMANFAGLAAARHAVLERFGWNVEENGLSRAPEVTILVGEGVHAAVGKVLSLLGFGRERVLRIPTDDQGRIRAGDLPAVNGPAILCVQAGNVNTGAFDPFRELVAWAKKSDAWVHVDGAFGLWAAASPRFRELTNGVERADSWATDGHKWLNVPYDSGLVLVREPRHLAAAMAGPTATYLAVPDATDRFDYTPEMSRRARGVDAWAALLSLGRSGLAQLIERCCVHARSFARDLGDGGGTVLNDVVLNQVLVRFRDDAHTRRVVRAVQRDGTCWCGETTWKGQFAMRISVSSGKTTEEDVRRSVAAILRVARELHAVPRR